ncbi:hypothetical protein ncot_11525 [Nocardioides sp. JQ2195]|uniref:hypothetical protein n=1 Tax=Nocardioides sp. JQ2195 TaxID=2592334 RepID=UPI00143EA3A9|nr:hypothetical protein [Nocardioides sp. JQ2195]QIX27157.1 hypothetical protein ncot_11525 [Nocardioides sp. JQ2195]
MHHPRDTVTATRTATGTGTATALATAVATRTGVADADTLLVRVGAGDRDAFAALYDATSVLAFHLARCLDPHDAEALLRASYLEVWRTASRFDPARMRAVPWILGVVRACARSANPTSPESLHGVAVA